MQRMHLKAAVRYWADSPARVEVRQGDVRFCPLNQLPHAGNRLG